MASALQVPLIPVSGLSVEATLAQGDLVHTRIEMNEKVEGGRREREGGGAYVPEPAQVVPS